MTTTTIFKRKVGRAGRKAIGDFMHDSADAIAGGGGGAEPAEDGGAEGGAVADGERKSAQTGGGSAAVGAGAVGDEGGVFVIAWQSEVEGMEGFIDTHFPIPGKLCLDRHPRAIIIRDIIIEFLDEIRMHYSRLARDLELNSNECAKVVRQIHTAIQREVGPLSFRVDDIKDETKSRFKILKNGYVFGRIEESMRLEIRKIAKIRADREFPDLLEKLCQAGFTDEDGAHDVCGEVSLVLRRGAGLEKKFSVTLTDSSRARAATIVGANNLNGLTIFHVAALLGRDDLLRYLRELRCRPAREFLDAGNSIGQTAFHLALLGFDAGLTPGTQVKFRTVMEQLLQFGVSPVSIFRKAGEKGRRFIGCMPIHAVAMIGDVRLMKVLLQNENVRKKESIDEPTPDVHETYKSCRAIEIALKKGDMDMVKVLRENGADLDYSREQMFDVFLDGDVMAKFISWILERGHEGEGEVDDEIERIKRGEREAVELMVELQKRLTALEGRWNLWNAAKEHYIRATAAGVTGAVIGGVVGSAVPGLGTATGVTVGAVVGVVAAGAVVYYIPSPLPGESINAFVKRAKEEVKKLEEQASVLQERIDRIKRDLKGDVDGRVYSDEDISPCPLSPIKKPISVPVTLTREVQIPGRESALPAGTTIDMASAEFYGIPGDAYYKNRAMHAVFEERRRKRDERIERERRVAAESHGAGAGAGELDTGAGVGTGFDDDTLDDQAAAMSEHEHPGGGGGGGGGAVRRGDAAAVAAIRGRERGGRGAAADTERDGTQARRTRGVGATPRWC